jgi:UDP-3-O-[3-hydroxymyristoyl] glucosamine N-acyltransferase
MRLGELAERLGCVLEGDAALEITDVAGIEEAVHGQLTFLSNPRYRAAATSTKASAILASPGDGPMPVAVLRSKNPYLDFARALSIFHQAPKYAPGIHPTASISSSARIGANAHIGPYCVVSENVALGDNAVLHSFVTIYRGASIGDDFMAHSHTVVRERVRIGHRVTLQNGAVVGSDGFGFAKQTDGSWYKIPQAGIAVIGDDVEIQANSTLDRATMGETHIANGAKIDNLVHVAHAVKVGENTLLCAQVGIAGSAKVGKNCVLTGQVGVVGHLTIGDGAVITPQSGVPNDVPAGALYSGSPVIEHKNWLKSVAVFSRLPELQKQVRELTAEVARLRARS